MYARPQSPNVLLTAGMNAKVADLGLSRIMQASIVTMSAHSSTNTPTGTFHWRVRGLKREDA